MQAEEHDPPDECEERRRQDVSDVPLLETHPLLTEELDVATCHYFDSSDEEEENVGNGRIRVFQLDASTFFSSFQLSSWTPLVWKSGFEKATCTTTSAKNRPPSFAR